MPRYDVGGSKVNSFMLEREKDMPILVLAKDVIRHKLGSGQQLYLLASYQIVDFTAYNSIDNFIVSQIAPKTPFIPLFNNKLKSIDKQAFVGSAIQRLWLPDSVKTIEYGAFANCQYLEDVDVPGITYVADMAFANCKKLIFASFGPAKYIADSAFADCNLSELYVARPSNYVKAMLGWPFGVNARRIRALPDAFPFINLAWNADRRLLLEQLDGTHSQMFATDKAFEPVVDFSECNTLTNALIRRRVGNVDRKIHPVFGKSLSAIIDNGFSWHTGIDELKDLEQVQLFGSHALEGTMTEVPCKFGCKILSAEALAGFKQEIVLGNLDYVGSRAFAGCNDVKFVGDVLGIQNFAFDSLEQNELSLFGNVEFGEWSFGCQDGPKANSELSIWLSCTYDELERQSAWPFGLKVENIFAQETAYDTTLILSPIARLRRMKFGQVYCARKSSICDETNSQGFFRSDMRRTLLRNGLTGNERIDLIFGDKLKFISGDAFADCQVKPIVHA